MDIIIVLMVFLAGALVATLLVWYPLHRRYQETETYEQLCDDVEQIRSQLVSYYDVEQRSRQLMRLIRIRLLDGLGLLGHAVEDAENEHGRV